MQTKRWLLPVAGLVTGLVLLSSSRATGQEATAHIEIPSTQIDANGLPFKASVIVEDVTNLGAFQIGMTYDPAVLELGGVEEGPFLGSSGRQVQCLPPRMQTGSLDFTCVTLGAKPDGPTGSGVLAMITFHPLASGSSALHFTRLTLADPPGQAMPASAQDGTVTVGGGGGGGFPWILWGPIIGAAALAVLVAGGFTWRVRRSRRQ